LDRVLYIIPGVGLPDQELSRREKVLNTFADNQFRVDVRAVREGPASIESYYDEYLSVPDSVSVAKEAEKSGYVAVIMGCYGDPGTEALREMLEIPVIGPGETSLYTAAMLGHEFSILSVLKNIIHPLKMLALKVGLQDRLSSVRVIDKPVLSVGDDIEGTKRALLRAGRAAVSEDGADTLILGCMSEAFLGLAADLQRELKVPVVDPVGTSVKMAELILANGLTHSKKAYPPPPRKEPVAVRRSR
jgi:allantoin racemase